MLRNALHYFAAVVKHGSIRAAAETLHVAQSAVSRQLQALEHDLGAPLFERRARGVALTDAGELLDAYVRGAVLEIERVRSEIEALRGLHRGHVRLCTVESHIEDVLPGLIDTFRTTHPGVTFQVTTGGSDRVVHAVRHGEADIGICFNQELTSDLRTALHKPERVMAVMIPEHPLANARTLSLSQLTDWPIGLSMRWSGTRKLVESASARAGIMLKPVLETNSISLLHRFALTGQGITFLVRAACSESLQKGELVAVPLVDAALGGAATSVITLLNRQLPVAAESFLMKLCEAMGNESGGGKTSRRSLRRHA